MPQTNFALPIKLDGSNEVNAESIAKYYAHVEKDHRGGYYPLGANTIWHGGIHIRAPRGTEVFSMLPGKIIAAKLPENEGVAIRRYGHIGFILLEHVFKSQKMYSLYCHLDNIPLSESDSKIAKVAWLATGGIAANLGRLKTGDLVRFDIPVKAGDLLWFSGLHGSPSSRAELLHWEVFSEARLFDEVPLATPPQTLRPWRVVADTDGNFNVDSPKIRGMLPAAISEDGNLTLDEIVAFYKGNPQGKAATLRDTACRFVSEWGIPDLDQACKELKNRWYFEASPKDNIAPFQWWQQAIEAQVALPSSPHVWHYHPVRILEEVKWIEDTAPYGGFALALNDSDATKQWGGEVRTVDGEFVAELQRDLVALGYWVSNPASATGKGRVSDGDFGANVEKAVKTFQTEEFCIDASGNWSAVNLAEVTGIVSLRTAQAIKARLDKMGQRLWSRPGHQTSKTWTVNGTATAPISYGRFFQVVPSEGYCRETIDFGSNNGIAHTKLSGVNSRTFEAFPESSCDWMMADCWGVESQVNLLRTVGDLWASKVVSSRAVPIFTIRDVSGPNGGPMDPHRTHQDGTGVDLGGTICSVRDFTEDWHRECALELAKLLRDNGARRILVNCHYIIKEVSIAQEAITHHHHFHVDGADSPPATTTPLAGNTRYTTCNQCGIYSTCTKRIRKIKKDAASVEVDYDLNAAKGSSDGLYATGDSRSSGVIKLSQVTKDSP